MRGPAPSRPSAQPNFPAAAAIAGPTNANPGGLARGEDTCVFAGASADSSGGLLRGRANFLFSLQVHTRRTQFWRWYCLHLRRGALGWRLGLGRCRCSTYEHTRAEALDGLPDDCRDLRARIHIRTRTRNRRFRFRCRCRFRSGICRERSCRHGPPDILRHNDLGVRLPMCIKPISTGLLHSHETG